MKKALAEINPEVQKFAGNPRICDNNKSYTSGDTFFRSIHNDITYLKVILAEHGLLDTYGNLNHDLIDYGLVVPFQYHTPDHLSGFMEPINELWISDRGQEFFLEFFQTVNL